MVRQLCIEEEEKDKGYNDLANAKKRSEVAEEHRQCHVLFAVKVNFIL